MDNIIEKSIIKSRKLQFEDEFNNELEACYFDEKYYDYFSKLINQNKKLLNDCNSVISYVTGITDVKPKIELHPIEIDQDLPDIDVDFPDVTRKNVVKQLTKDYGESKVKNIANISKLQGRSAIGNFAKNLNIPPRETEAVKDSLIERFSGHERANKCVEDTFKEIEVGKEFIKKYPAMEFCAEIEGHPDHSSVHAAGIIVCNDPVHFYGGVNARDNTIMLDKKGSEHQNLLKIDVLGLRTLSVLQECAELIGMDYTDYYSMSLDDQKAFELLTDVRVDGVFQFEGGALKELTKKMGVEYFEDIVALTALARPGALHSGGAARYIKYRLGEEKPIYIGKLHEEITKETFGIIVYQEQILRICREIGKMTWKDVNAVRKAFSKSLGDEYFSQYKDKFLSGAKQNNYTHQDSEFLWGEISHSGSYAFNKSHSVAYALISYQTAYMKANHPLEFVVACLNNAKDEETSIRTLRDAVVIDKIKYDPLDPEKSVLNWSVSGDKIIGGLTNIKGIGVQKARTIIKSRTGEEDLTPSLYKALINPKTPFDDLFPCNTYFKNIYDDPKEFGLDNKPSLIRDVNDKGEYLFIGRLTNKFIKDLNEHSLVEKRDGKYFENNTLSLSLRFEDDTDDIACSIGRFDYDELGLDIAENGVVDENYYLVMGEIQKDNFRFVNISNILKLNIYEYGHEEENFYAELR